MSGFSLVAALKKLFGRLHIMKACGVSLSSRFLFTLLHLSTFL